MSYVWPALDVSSVQPELTAEGSRTVSITLSLDRLRSLSKVKEPEGRIFHEVTPGFMQNRGLEEDLVNTFHYGWRNLWRNTRRTLITLAAVTLSTAILISSYGLMDGLMQHAVSNATNLVVGEVQIHAPGYLADYSIYKALTDPDLIFRAVHKKNVPAAVRRYGYGLVAVGTKSAGARFWGVEPALERTTFDLAQHLDSGRFLPETPQRGLVLGQKLARSLRAQIGSEIVVVVQAADGSLGNDLFTVTGILKAAGDSIDRNAALIHAADFVELFVSGDRIHEIALNSRGELPLEDLDSLASAAAPEQEVKSWRQLLPEVSDMVNLFDAFIWIFGLIFLLAAGMGVMNTMLMATYERIREFGIIKALGATPWRIVRDVAAEALVLAALGTALGALSGLAGSYYLQEVGLDLSMFAGSYSVGGVAFDPIWKATISPNMVLIPVVLMLIISLVASLYPAALAARLDPVKAIHRP